MKLASALAATILALACSPAIAHESPDHGDVVRFGTFPQNDDFGDATGRRLGTRTGTRSLGAHSNGLGRLGDGTGTRRFGSHGDNLGSLNGASIEGGRDHGLGVYRGGGIGSWSGGNIGDNAAPPPRRSGPIRLGR
ncbi:MAG TPA: hypothetical protein VEL28_07270 [Candidatus Binatia bacterium]|nr:hypothetical protein [Candidatus Binatia bacterium]